MKKFIALILTLVLVLSLVSFASAEEKVVISLYRSTYDTDHPDAAEAKKVEDAINAYIADKINVEIRLSDIQAGEYPEKARMALEYKEVNLLWTAAWLETIGCNDLVPKNAVYDITDLLPGTALYASMEEGQWEATKYNGRNYFIPVYKDNVEGYDFMFRKELVDKYGWDVTTVQKLEDLEPMLAEAAADDLKYPLLLQGTAMFYRFMMDRFDFFTGDASSNFVAVDREKGEVVNTVQTEEYKNYCKLMGRWAEEGYISEDEANRMTNDNTPKTKDWAVSWWTDTPVNIEANTRYGQEMVMQPATKRYSHSTSALGSCYCISASSTEEQAKACVDFMGLLYTDKTLADLYTFGIEGADADFEYTREEGQEIDHVTQHSEKYNHQMWNSASATIVSPKNDEPDNKAELYRLFNGGAEVSVAAGFRFDKGPVESKYDACREVFRNYGFQLETGAIPADAVEDYIAEYQDMLDAAGYQDVLKAFKKQFSDWLAARE